MATTHLLSGSTHHLIRTTPLLQSSVPWRNTNNSTPPSFNLNFTPLFSSHSIKPFKISLKCTAKPPLNPISEPDIQPQVPDPTRADDIMDTILNAVKELTMNTKSEDIMDNITSTVEGLMMPEADTESEAGPTWVDDAMDTILSAAEELKVSAIPEAMDTIVNAGKEFINPCSNPKHEADTRPEYPDPIRVRVDDIMDTIQNAVRKVHLKPKPKADTRREDPNLTRVDGIMDTITNALEELKTMAIHEKSEADTRSEDPDEIMDAIRTAVKDLLMEKRRLNPKPEADTQPQDPDSIRVDKIMDTITSAVKELPLNIKSEADNIMDTIMSAVKEQLLNPKSKADIQIKDPSSIQVDGIMHAILNVVEALKNPAVALVLKGVFSSWAALSSSSSSSSSSRSSDSGHSLSVTDIACMIGCLVLVDIMAYQMSGESIWSGMKKTTVVKLQVGLSGSVRSLQKELNWIAGTADTSTLEGLSFVLTESAVALLRLPDNCISAYSFVDVENTAEKGEKLFNKFSIEERAKFDEETMANVNNMRRNRRTSLQSDGLSNEYIVITILVAAKGDHKLPTINGIKDLKDALQKLGLLRFSGLHMMKAMCYRRKNLLKIIHT